MPKLKRAGGRHCVRKYKKDKPNEKKAVEVLVTPRKLLAAQIMAFDLHIPSENAAVGTAPTSLCKVQSVAEAIVTPVKLRNQISVTASPYVQSDSVPEPRKNIQEFVSEFQPSQSVDEARVTPVKLKKQISVTASPCLQNICVSEPRRNLQEFFSEFQPSPCVDEVRVTPVKLRNQISVTASPCLQNICVSEPRRNLQDFFSEFQPSPVVDEVRGIQLKLDVVLPSQSNDVVPLNDDTEIVAPFVTHNARRKIPLDMSTEVSLQNNKNCTTTSEELQALHKVMAEDDNISEVMNRVSLEHTPGTDVGRMEADETADSTLVTEGNNSGNESEDEVQEVIAKCKVCICATCGAKTSKSKDHSRPLSYAYLVTKSEEVFRKFTGLSKSNFLAVFEFVGGEEMFSKMKYEYRNRTPTKRGRRERPDALTYHDRLLITLMRLRRGFFVEDLSLTFNVSSTLIGEICYVVIQLMYTQFQRLKEAMFTTRAAQTVDVLPACLKPFKNYRCTIDTTEVRIQVPYNYRQQGNTYSQYKSGNVINYLVACNCWGAVSFISPGFEGNISDIELFKVSGICDYLHPDDVLLVDRGFLIEEHTDPLRVKVVRPAFLGDRQVFSKEEDLMNKKFQQEEFILSVAFEK